MNEKREQRQQQKYRMLVFKRRYIEFVFHIPPFPRPPSFLSVANSILNPSSWKTGNSDLSVKFLKYHVFSTNIQIHNLKPTSLCDYPDVIRIKQNNLKYPGLWKILLRLMNTVLMILSELITKLYELEYSPLLPRTLSVFPANPTRTFDT